MGGHTKFGDSTEFGRLFSLVERFRGLLWALKGRGSLTFENPTEFGHLSSLRGLLNLGGRKSKFGDSSEFWETFQPGGILKFRNSI